MSDWPKLHSIGSTFCNQYDCEARFYIEPPGSGEPRPGTGTGLRHLVVLYGKGYTGPNDRPIAANGQREFAVGIPDDWSKEKLLAFLLRPGSQNEPLPSWEASTRSLGLIVLKDVP
jgi:hypothetical protein